MRNARGFNQTRSLSHPSNHLYIHNSYTCEGMCSIATLLQHEEYDYRLIYVVCRHFIRKQSSSFIVSWDSLNSSVSYFHSFGMQVLFEIFSDLCWMSFTALFAFKFFKEHLSVIHRYDKSLSTRTARNETSREAHRSLQQQKVTESSFDSGLI